MRLIRLLSTTSKIQHAPCVATIGDFDGVHLGHQELITDVVNKAKQSGLLSMVILFEPQPLEFFLKDKAPARLTILREKVELIKRLGVDTVTCIVFSETIRQLHPIEFIDKVLNQQLSVKQLVIGDDFKFGRNRQGDYSLLVEQGKVFDYSVEQIKPILLNHVRVSSTKIRERLTQSDFPTVTSLLGREYGFCYRVVYGNQLGRTLSIPTANLYLKRGVVPIAGVFAVEVSHNQRKFYGVANIGTRPVVNGKEVNLEVYIFDFSEEIYGQKLKVIPKYKIREERNFKNIEVLKEKILEDIQLAKAFFRLK